MGEDDNEIQEAYAEGFDARREVLMGEDAKLLILKVDGGVTEYELKMTVESAWSASFSEFYGSTTFTVARSDNEFTDALEEASHVVVKDSNSDALNNKLHIINRETTIPAGIDPYWRVRATPTNQRYAP